MVQSSDGFDLRAVLRQTTPSTAMGTIAARLDGLPAESATRFREAVVSGFEELFARDTAAAAGWFEILVDSPLLRDRADDGDGTLAGDGVGGRLCRLLVVSLDSLTPEERGRRLGAAAVQASDVSILCAALTAIEHERDEAFLGGSVPDCRKVVLARIDDLAATPAFWAQRDPAALLWFWFAHGEEQRVYLFTSRAMEEPAGLTALLTVPLETEGSGAETQEVVAVRRWSKIIDFRSLEARAVACAMSAPSRTERRRARRFLEAFGTGKSELFR
jgi:hypothetical protein